MSELQVLNLKVLKVLLVLLQVTLHEPKNKGK